MNYQDETARLYDRSAASWSRNGPLLLSDFTARPFVLEWCESVRYSSVLDLGCGEGYVARQLRRRGAVVRGLDVSEQMIARALEHESKDPLGIDFAVGDATDLAGIDSGSIDLVVAVFLFNYLDRAGTTAAMSEVARVLRPGGRFIFTVPHPSLPFMRSELPPFYFDRRGLGYFSARDATLEGRIWRRDGEVVPVRCVHKTLEDLFRCLADAGLQLPVELRELRVTHEHVALDPEFFGPLEDTPLHLMFRLSLPTVNEGSS